MEQKVLAETSPEAQTKIEYAELVRRITGQIHAATNLDQILLDLHKGILSLFDSEEVVVFALDPEKKEIFSKLPHHDAILDIRVPITEQSLAGFAAKYLRPVNIGDARVSPGDILRGDADGVVVLPQGHEEEILDIAENIETVEQKIRTSVKGGMSLKEARTMHKYHTLQRKNN